MRVVAVVQARMASTRLRGKVLLPVAGRPMLARMVARVMAASSLDDVVIATTRGAEDEPIRDLARFIGVPVYSGHPTDLLDRHYRAALWRRADAVVKIPSDCPLIDPAIIDRVVRFFRGGASSIDYASNLHPATYPDGNDVEILHFSALETAWREAERDLEREHTTPFVWDQPARFRIGNIAWESGRNLSMTHRFTVDYPEDYEFVAAVYRELGLFCPLGDILDLLDEREDIFAINAHLAGVNWYRHHIGQLRTVGASETVAHD